MPKRRRWTPIEGTTNRIYDPKERWLLRTLDLPARLAFGVARLGRRRPSLPPRSSVRELLVLRLDRIGDVLMSFPALGELRAAFPEARIRLAVGRWSETIAQSAPVDEVLVWSAPWVGRPSEGAETLGELARKARLLGNDKPDIALDLQGDIRAAALMWLTGARIRVGYANTGGDYLLSHVVDLDETVSWVEQNRRAVAVVTRQRATDAIADPLKEFDRQFARYLFKNLDLEESRPLVGLHPSGGRIVKQWDLERWHQVAGRLQKDYGATILVTGSKDDGTLAEKVIRGLPGKALDLTGRLSIREALAVIAQLDLFLSPDTGPMHMACATGTPSVSVFGPSDPVRYFSGTHLTPGGRAGSWHVVARKPLWCSPCNLIRKPPKACLGPEGPECLRGVTVNDVYDAAGRLLREGGFAARGA